MPPLLLARHLLRARDLIDPRYAEPLDAVPADAPHGASGGAVANTDWSVAEICFDVGLRSVGSFTTSFGRTYAMSPTAYRAAHPPAARLARVPSCVARAHARPRSSTFREDSASGAG